MIFKHFFFLRVLQRSLYTHPPAVAALFWNFYERKLLSGGIGIWVHANNFFS